MTKDEARRELARRELARRALAKQQVAEPAPSVADGMTLSPFGIDTGIPLPVAAGEALAGVGRRMTDIGTLGTAERSPEADAALDQSVPAMLGGMAVDMATMALGGGALKGLSAIPKIGGALSTAGSALQTPKTALQALTGSAAYGAATSQDRLEGAVSAGAGGLGGYGAGKALALVLKPAVTPSARTLLENDVRITIGDVFGGWAKAAEEKAMSIPGIGDMIRSAKLTAIDDFNRAILSKVVEPLGVHLDDASGVGVQAIDDLYKVVSEPFDRLLPQMNVTLDKSFLQEVSKLKSMSLRMPDAQRKQFLRIMDSLVLRQFKNPTRTMLGQTMREVDTEIGGLAYNIRRSPAASPSEQQLGSALGELQESLRRLVERSNPDQAPQLQAARQAYHRYKIVEDAASRGTAVKNGGVFTPSQLLESVKKQAGKRRIARGDATRPTFYKEAQAGAEAMTQSVPDSGTPGRVMAAALGGGAIAGIEPTLAAGMATGMAAYSQPGQTFLRYLFAERTPAMKAAGATLEELAPYLAVPGTAGMLNYPR